MTSTLDTPQDGWKRRERPWLIPSNRKLRHLQSITLRNLNLDQHHARLRRQTIDDEALPTTTKSPAKLLALRESSQLSHSRSQDNLRPIHENAQSSTPPNHDAPNGTTTPTNSPTKSKVNTPPRPSFAKMRRRSTLEWTSATSMQRQKRLEDVSASRLANLFFSLHISGIEAPIYVSEVAERVMNPNFRHIHLDGCPPYITRLDTLTVRFWAKTERQSHYNILLDITLSLRSLQFIGKSLASFHHPFPPNCVLFQLTDGFYTAFTDARVDEPLNPFAGLPIKESSRQLPTSSFDALLRLSKLDDTIQDASALRESLSAELEDVVQSHSLAFPVKGRVAQAEDFVKTINFATKTVQKQLKALQSRRDEKRRDLQKRRDFMAYDRESMKIVNKHIASEKVEIQNMREQKQILQKSISAQRRRISTDITKVYPIDPLPDRQLAFTVRGLHLPNSGGLDSAKNVTPETIAAALGHVSHILQLMSFYWTIILPYHPNPRSSTSTIYDPISILQSSGPSGPSPFASASALANSSNERAMRTFPLFTRSAVRFRFDYGLFLINKDIQLLLEGGWNVRVLDIRQTLPNLLLALHCATAGEGELPARKAGGVRGLTRSARERAELKRRDSEDSTTLVGSDMGGDIVGDLGAFESLKRVGKRRERRLDGSR